MKRSPAPKAWQKIAPDTIEAWLVSGDPAQERLAEETLTHLGDGKAQEYLLHLLTREDASEERIRCIAARMMLVITLPLFIAWFATKSTTFIVSVLLISMVPPILNLFLVFSETRLRRAIAEYALRHPDLSNIALLLKSLKSVGDEKIKKQILDTLPDLLAQITPANKELIPESHLADFVKSLNVAVKQTVPFSSTGFVMLKAHLLVCGVTRYAPSLPTLQALAKREATMPQEQEIVNLATHFVAEWDTPTVAPLAPDAYRLKCAGNYAPPPETGFTIYGG